MDKVKFTSVQSFHDYPNAHKREVFASALNMILEGRELYSCIALIKGNHDYIGRSYSSPEYRTICALIEEYWKHTPNVVFKERWERHQVNEYGHGANPDSVIATFFKDSFGEHGAWARVKAMLSFAESIGITGLPKFPDPQTHEKISLVINNIPD